MPESRNMEPQTSIAALCDPRSPSSEALDFAAGFSSQSGVPLSLLVPDDLSVSDREIRSIFDNSTETQTQEPENIVRIPDPVDALPESIDNKLPFECVIVGQDDLRDFERIADSDQFSDPSERLTDQVIQVPNQRENNQSEIKHLVVPIDDESDSQVLLSTAKDWALQLECDVAIVHAVGILAAVQPHPLPIPYATEPVIDRIVEDLDRKVASLRDNAIDVSINVDFGDIPSVVRDSDLDLDASLAICSPEHNRKTWWILGRSVVNEFSDQLSIPVLSTIDHGRN